MSIWSFGRLIATEAELNQDEMRVLGGKKKKKESLGEKNSVTYAIQLQYPGKAILTPFQTSLLFIFQTCSTYIMWLLLTLHSRVSNLHTGT